MFKQTAELIKKLSKQHIVPGVSYALINNHQVISNYLGSAQLVPTEMPLQAEQLYDLASLTKIVGTTTLVLNLMEHQQLDIDESIQQWLPAFQDSRITIRHLLTHTSGVRGYIPYRNELPADKLKEALLALPVTDTFENKVVYTDVGLLYVGWIIENILHKPIQQLITEQVLLPLGMTHTTFKPDKNLAVPTEIDVKRGLIQGVVHDPKSYILKEHSGAVGMFSTLSDLVRFNLWYLGQLAIDQAPVSQNLLTKIFVDWSPHHLGHSLGWDICRSPYDHHVVLYHTGFTGTFMAVDRQNQTAMIVLTNRVHPTADNQLFLTKRDEIVEMFLHENK